MRSKGVIHEDTEILVPFFDVDTMHVVWHGHYVKYLEVARCALLDKLGHNYTHMLDSGYAWPVIDLQLRYVRGARMAICLRERRDESGPHARISVRAEERLRADLFCAEFGGGGHAAAAGCRHSGEFDAIVERVIKCANQWIDEKHPAVEN